MSKILITFLSIIVFVVGVSVGMYYGTLPKEQEVVEEKKVIDSVQDVVIKNVQSKQDDKLEEVAVNVEKVSPYAKMIIEKKFSKCGHTTVNILDVPKELVNLTEEEIKERYSGWELKEFSSQEFTLFRVIEANCDDHFVLKNEGRIYSSICGSY